jgi:NDP-sugar pyrophosphorylase family protein
MAIDPSARIASTAKVHPNAHVGPQTVVGEFCIIEEDVTVGANNVVEPYVFLKRWGMRTRFRRRRCWAPIRWTRASPGSAVI